MAKNFADIYNRTGDAIAIEQSYFAVLETTKGTYAPPTDTDFFFSLAGGNVSQTQPKTPSAHRSGRHITDFTFEKKVTEWTVPTHINIDTSLGAPAAAEIDPAIRLLWRSMLGGEVTTAGAVYQPNVVPDITFSLYENGDMFAHQARGAFVQTGTLALPGDGLSTMEYAGNSADRLRVGIARSSADNNTGNVVTVEANEAKRIPVGAQVMLIETDGTTRSADTPNGSYRTVTARDTGANTVTVDGAALADADGSGTPIYLAYAEPETPTAINNIQTGLVGSATIVGLTQPCFRGATITFNNNHELVDYCFGTDNLLTPFFVPGARLIVDVETEINLNHNTLEFFDDLEDFTAQNMTLVLGAAAGRRLEIALPNVTFDKPNAVLPDEGSIPVSLSGMAAQTALQQENEVTASFI